uniref:BEACH domain-containing protein n=1 Tax=Skeletonema marinoi TaxID=267567 RepID=A0A7S2PGR8_9STRA
MSKEVNLRSFLESDWVSNFLDVDTLEDFEIPEQVANGQMHDKKKASTRGKEAMLELIAESKAIVKEYSALLNEPFGAFCESQRKWAETDAVRDREYEGDLLVKRLSSKHRTDTSESNRLVVTQFALASQRMAAIQRLMNDPWDLLRRWEVSTHTDLLYRRILFSPNYCFTNHASASYELTLGKDREAFQKEEISRQEREKEKEIELALRVAVVPYEESVDEEVEEDDDERAGSDGFFGWVEMEGVEATLDRSHCSDEEEEVVEVIKDDTEDETAEESDWDEIDAAEMESTSDPFDWARKFLWSDGEHPLQNFENVAIVSVQTFIEGIVLLTSHSIYFHQTGDVIDVMTKEKFDVEGKKPKPNRRWKLNQMTDVHGRRYMMKAQGLELFFSDMQGLFLKFNGVKDRDSFHSKLRSNCKVPLLRSFKSLNPRTVFKKSMLTDLWLKRRISNFQYIMALNLMAGRTFNDICQYPVFPWILNDYQSETLDLNDPSIYRDLSKPVGALNPDRLAMLIERYNDLDGFPEEQNFLYGSHYSSPGVVLHYMLRQEPFTSMHIALQSGRFDCPDRLFFDLAGCWRSCLTSTSDVKELTPEFFTCPEIFTNTNNFPLGETQDNKQISNVKLPPWAKGSPHEFIRIHRLALESDYVSRHLHHWIDLIFGYKQRGPASSAAHNVFHYYSYEGSVDLDKITDEIERKAIEGHIQNFGQTPSQLITKLPHPERSAKEKQPIAPFKSLHAGDLKVHTPAKQFGGPKSSCGAILSLHAIGDSVFVLHSDFTLCSYKLNATRNNALPVQIKADKCRMLENSSPLPRTVDNEEQSNEQGSNVMVNSDSFALTMGGNYRAADHGADSSLLLLSCDAFENVVKVHSIETLQLQRSVSGGHRGRINCIKVSEDGALMVTGGDDATCRVWVVEHDALATAITDGYVSSLGLDDNEITCAHVLFGHVSPITCVAICSKLDVVISGSKDGSICIHNIRSGKFVRSLHVDAVAKEVKDSCARSNGITPQKLVIHMDGSFIAYFSDGSLMVITINGQCICKADVGEKINAMLICHESEALITGGELGSVRVRTLYDLRVQCTLNIKKYGPITTLALTSDPNFLCVGSSNGFLSVVFRNTK